MMKKVCCQWDGRRPISRKNKRIQGCHWRTEPRDATRQEGTFDFTGDTFFSKSVNQKKKNGGETRGRREARVGSSDPRSVHDSTGTIQLNNCCRTTK